MVVNEVVVEEAGATTNVVIVVQMRMGQANGVVRCIYPEIRMLMSTLTCRDHRRQASCGSCLHSS